MHSTHISSSYLNCNCKFNNNVMNYNSHNCTRIICTMESSGVLRRVALVVKDVSEKLRASFIRMTWIGELGTTLAVTSTRRTLRRNVSSYKSHTA
jgi:hypothetical protein